MRRKIIANHRYVERFPIDGKIDVLRDVLAQEGFKHTPERYPNPDSEIDFQCSKCFARAWVVMETMRGSVGGRSLQEGRAVWALGGSMLFDVCVEETLEEPLGRLKAIQK